MNPTRSPVRRGHRAWQTTTGSDQHRIDVIVMACLRESGDLVAYAFANDRNLEGSMNRCPYCQALCNPMRIFNYSLRKPYTCGRCGKTSKFVVWQLVAMASLLAGIGGGFATAFVPAICTRWGLVGAAVVFGVGALLLIQVLMFFPRLRPIETIDDQTGKSTNSS